MKIAKSVLNFHLPHRLAQFVESAKGSAFFNGYSNKCYKAFFSAGLG
jgi:hypothetical protein